MFKTMLVKMLTAVAKIAIDTLGTYLLNYFKSQSKTQAA